MEAAVHLVKGALPQQVPQILAEYFHRGEAGGAAQALQSTHGGRRMHSRRAGGSAVLA